MLECRCHVLVQLLLQFMQVYAECYLVCLSYFYKSEFASHISEIFHISDMAG
jgi:hypothetical protein